MRPTASSDVALGRTAPAQAAPVARGQATGLVGSSGGALDDLLDLAAVDV